MLPQGTGGGLRKVVILDAKAAGGFSPCEGPGVTKSFGNEGRLGDNGWSSSGSRVERKGIGV